MNCSSPSRSVRTLAALGLLLLAATVTHAIASIAPVITAQPDSQVVAPGATVTFSVTATGSPAPTYAWYKSGVGISGASTNSLKLTSVSTSNANGYYVVVTNSAGSVQSQAVTLTVIPTGVFFITNYGAVADGTTDCTSAINNAFIAANAAGGGTVEVPAPTSGTAPYMFNGLSFVNGGSPDGSNINFQIDTGATLRAFPYAATSGTTYSGSTSQIIYYGSCANMEISGGGTIDGNGGSGWWTDGPGGSYVSARPYLITIKSCSPVLVQGVTISNSPMEHLVPSNCTNVTIRNVTISCPVSPNTDGMDPSGNHFLIENCTVADGDDNIVLKPGSYPCSDITVNNCTFGIGHGLSVGGQTNKGLNGFYVNNCTFNGTTSGLRLKADASQGGITQNVVYSNITMTNVEYPIVFYSYYREIGNPGGSAITKVQQYNNTPPDNLSLSMVAWHNITINNLTATGATQPSIIWGLPASGLYGSPPTTFDDYFIYDVVLNNVVITGNSNAGLKVYNAHNVQCTGTTSFSGGVLACNGQAIVTQPQSQSGNIGGGVSLTVGVATSYSSVLNSSATQTPGYQWSFNGTALGDGPKGDGAVISGSATATLNLSNLTAAEAGSYTVAVTHALDNNTNLVSSGLVANSYSVTATSSPAVLTVVPLTITQQPVSVTAGAGQTAVFSITATGSTALSYQWKLGSAPISGATDSYLVLSNVQAGSAGSYTCVVTDTAGSVTSNAATLTISSSPDLGRIMNVSIRDNCGTGDNQLIAGFVIGGAGNDGGGKTVLIRGDGPTLASYGVSGALPDPALNVFQPSVSTTSPLFSNTGWNNDPTVASVSTQVGAFALGANSLDSALVQSLTPGSYTANVTGSSGDTGIALGEIYDATTSFTSTTPRLVNVSGRAQASTGASSLIAGFVIGGSTEKTVLVRGMGPTLANYGVTGVLPDPQVAVHQINSSGVDLGVIASNVGWNGDSALSSVAASVGAFGFASSASGDSAVLVSLPPGAYTANVTGASGDSGVALVEVYEVP